MELPFMPNDTVLIVDGDPYAYGEIRKIVKQVTDKEGIRSWILNFPVYASTNNFQFSVLESCLVNLSRQPARIPYVMRGH